MKILVPANNKGGVGKTSTSALFAEYASKILRKKVLGIDLDPQCNFSQRYISMEPDPAAPDGWMPPLHPDFDPTDAEECAIWDGRSSIANIFYGEEVIPYPTYIENFDIAPAYASKLQLAEEIRRNEVNDKIIQRMYEFLNLPEVQELYDVVIIDTRPSKGPLTRSAIKAATHLIIPTIMEDKGIQGVYGMMQLWMTESTNRSPDNKLNLVGILPNKFKSSTALHKNFYEDLLTNKSLGKFIIQSVISDRIAFAEVDTPNPSPSSIFDLPDSNNAKKEAILACKIIAERVFDE